MSGSSESRDDDSKEEVGKMSGSGSIINKASFKLILLIMMVIQNSSTVLVGRYTRSGVPKEEQYDVNHLILVCELGKLLLSFALEFQATNGKLMESLNIHVFANPLDALKILVPALLYLVQNTLLYVALSNLTAPIFQVTYQAKLVTTAFVSVLMLNRVYTFQQWVCLFVISLGVAIVVLGERKGDGGVSSSEDAKNQNLVVGLVAVTIACMSSALAGVYFEKVIKNPPAADGKQQVASVWMRNIQLAFFSVVIAFMQGIFKKPEPLLAGKPYLHGFGFWTWILVLLQSGGGLLVAAVIKYADNVLKGMATGVSVVSSSALSMLLFKTPLHGQFYVGGSMILSAVYIFSNPVKIGGPKDKGESEMKSLLPK